MFEWEKWRMKLHVYWKWQKVSFGSNWIENVEEAVGENLKSAKEKYLYEKKMFSDLFSEVKTYTLRQRNRSTIVGYKY